MKSCQPSLDKLGIRAGYLAPWDARGIATIVQGNADGGALTALSPVWYQPDELRQIVFASSRGASLRAGDSAVRLCLMASP